MPTGSQWSGRAGPVFRAPPPVPAPARSWSVCPCASSLPRTAARGTRHPPAGGVRVVIVAPTVAKVLGLRHRQGKVRGASFDNERWCDTEGPGASAPGCQGPHARTLQAAAGGGLGSGPPRQRRPHAQAPPTTRAAPPTSRPGSSPAAPRPRPGRSCRGRGCRTCPWVRGGGRRTR